MPNTLYVVATPIGNLNDISPRAAEALAAAGLIAAEDTRVTLKLLNHLGIKRPLISCHRHNEGVRAEEIIARMLDENIDVALTCDAGTPAISDPGYLLVDAAWRSGINVVPISGPSAVVTALSASGFDAREFAFYGFLPRDKRALKEKIAEIRACRVRVAVLFESPHRVVKLVAALIEGLGEFSIAVCCDLTKRYELIVRGRAEDVLSALSSNPNVEKGEYCLVLELPEIPPEPERDAPSLEGEIFARMLGGMSLGESAEAALSAGQARNRVYAARLKISEYLKNYAHEMEGES